MRTSATAFERYQYKHRLFQALEEVNFEQVKLILQRESNLIDSIDRRGDTPLHKLLRKLDGSQNDIDIIQIITYLIKKNAQLTILDKSGETVLSLMTKLSPTVARHFLSASSALRIQPNAQALTNNYLKLSMDNQYLRL